MDLTVLYRELVRLGGNETESEISPPSVEKDAVTEQCDQIASSLADIESALRQLRPQYLALGGGHRLSDKERDEIDYEIRSMLQTEQRKLRILEQRERERQQALEQSQMSGLRGFLGAGLDSRVKGASQTLSMHRQGMFYFLTARLQHVSMALADQQRVRYARVAKSRRPEPNPPPNLHAPPPIAEPNDLPIDLPIDLLSAQSQNVEPAKSSKMQQLLVENDELLEELNSTLDKAQQAEQSLQLIAELQTELSDQLANQSQQINRLGIDALRTHADLSGANKQLDSARKSNRRAARLVIFTSLGAGVLLLLLNGR